MDADGTRVCYSKPFSGPPSITDVLHYHGLLTGCISTRHNAATKDDIDTLISNRRLIVA